MLTYIMTLKSRLKVTQGHSNWYHSKAWLWFSIRHSYFLYAVAATLKSVDYNVTMTFILNNDNNNNNNNSNYGSILHQFRHKARYWSKIVIFYTPLHSTPPLGGPRRNIDMPLVWEN